jgi:hypothetical protein
MHCHTMAFGDVEAGELHATVKHNVLVLTEAVSFGSSVDRNLLLRLTRCRQENPRPDQSLQRQMESTSMSSFPSYRQNTTAYIVQHDWNWASISNANKEFFQCLFVLSKDECIICRRDHDPAS